MLQIGIEEILVAYLLVSAKPKHEMLSVFTPANIRGYVYLECNMNQDIQGLLRRSPGVIHSHNEIVRMPIEISDRVKLFNVKTPCSSFSQGEWIRITRGAYKGDIGLIHSIHNWGADVLLVPRIPYCSPDRKGKRKASSIPITPKLFDVTEFESTSPLPATHHHDGSYTIGRLRIIDGLALKSVNYLSMSSNTFGVPGHILSQFILSGHPSIDITVMPMPLEWQFLSGERVRVIKSSKMGAIHATTERQVEVEIDGEGIFVFGWQEVQKNIQTGDYVTAATGTEKGYEGWVVELHKNLAKVAPEINATEMDAQLNVRISIVLFHLTGR